MSHGRGLNGVSVCVCVCVCVYVLAPGPAGGHREPAEEVAG